MKTRILSFASLFFGICLGLSLSSCVNLEPEKESKNGTITIQFDGALASENGDDTRTGYYQKTIQWEPGDQINFYQYAQVDGDMTYKSTYGSVSKATSLLSFTIGTFNKPDEGSDSFYFSVYPRASYAAYSTSSGAVQARINTPATQTPKADSYDPAADLLISDYTKNLSPRESDGKYEVQLKYYRQVALGKMTIKNLPSESKITSVVLTAVKDGTRVVLAGAKWYSFIDKGPTSDYSNSTSLTLDYSSLEVYGNESMTAHFCCYPFELGGGDWFQVVVTTEDGKSYTRKVELSPTQNLIFEKGKATQFTVNMQNALEGDSWIVLNEHNSGSYVKTTYCVCFTVKSTMNNIKSGKFKAVTEDTFSGITDISAYLDENGSNVSATTIKGLNAGTVYNFRASGLTGDEWCIAMVKFVLDDDKEGIALVRIKTDWFYFTAETRTKGGIKYTYFGKDLASTTRNYRIIKTADLPENHTFESYYNSVLSPGGIPSETLSAINDDEGKNGASYYTTKYHADRTTTATMTPGDSYTVMIKAVNTRGETTFRYVTVTAGGNTESSVPASTTDPVVSLGTAVNDGVNF